MEKIKNIALIAHDHRKDDLIHWVKQNEGKLAKHHLFGTGTTSSLVNKQTNLDVFGFKSGPLGGDMQIASKIVNGEIDFLIFFWDPMESQPHDPDVKALLRIAVLYDIPTANNMATADFLLTSPLMEEDYNQVVIDYSNRIKKG